MNPKTKKFETHIATFSKIKNTQIVKKFKPKYLYLFNEDKFRYLLKLNSNFIIKLLSISSQHKTLTFEYFESITLRERLKFDESINFNELKNILESMAKAIDYLHQNNIAHIDIDDTNILINSSLECKLNDFDFIEILDKQNKNLKQIDIHSYIILLYRIIQLPKQWNALQNLKFSYTISNKQFTTCLDFLQELKLTHIKD